MNTLHTPTVHERMFLSWEAVNDGARQLAEQITSHCMENDFSYHAMVYLPRGGLHVANLLSRYLNFGADQMLSFAMTSYKPGTTIRAGLRYGQTPLKEEVSSANLLVVDEVCDTGRSLERVVHYLQNLGAIAIHSAVLDYKPSKTETGYEPDFYVRETNKWLVYPWENAEDIGLGNRVVNNRLVREDADRAKTIE